MREALLKAAHQIETSPDSYFFDNGQYPVNHSCDAGVTCALGWVGFFAGVAEQRKSYRFWLKAALHMNIINEATGKPYQNRESAEAKFYTRMDELVDHHDWRLLHTVCARALRLYADKYHPATQHQGLPPVVTEIFEDEKEIA